MCKRAFLLLVLFLGVIACGPQAPVEQVDPVPVLSPLHGAWRGLDIQTVTATGEVTEVDMQENLLLFTEGYYTIAYSSGDERFPPYAARWAATDEEKVARIDSIVVNGGTYDVTGSTLVMRPQFAITPGFVNGRSEYEYEISGAALTLTLTNVVSSDDIQLPAFADGGRIIYRLARLE